MLIFRKWREDRPVGDRREGGRGKDKTGGKF